LMVFSTISLIVLEMVRGVFTDIGLKEIRFSDRIRQFFQFFGANYQ
jgi:hypothetical protein